MAFQKQLLAYQAQALASQQLGMMQNVYGKPQKPNEMPEVDDVVFTKKDLQIEKDILMKWKSGDKAVFRGKDAFDKLNTGQMYTIVQPRLNENGRAIAEIFTSEGIRIDDGYLLKNFERVNTNKMKGNSYMQSFKEYLSKHKDVFYTIAVVFLIDHFVFNGAFKGKLQQIVEKVLDSAHKKLDSGGN